MSRKYDLTTIGTIVNCQFLIDSIDNYLAMLKNKNDDFLEKDYVFDCLNNVEDLLNNAHTELEGLKL